MGRGAVSDWECKVIRDARDSGEKKGEMSSVAQL